MDWIKLSNTYVNHLSLLGHSKQSRNFGHPIARGILSASHIGILQYYDKFLAHKFLSEHIAIFWVFQLFVSHLVRMVFVTDQALVSVRPGGLTADAE